MKRDQYVHQVINHAERYVDGRVHTNGLENLWALLKRGLHGTYVSVEPFHLYRYLDEQMFRYNHRKDGDHKVTDSERFALAMSQVAGKRLTDSQLTGKNESPRYERVAFQGRKDSSERNGRPQLCHSGINREEVLAGKKEMIEYELKNALL
jgi:hypothetical protein